MAKSMPHVSQEKASGSLVACFATQITCSALAER